MNATEPKDDHNKHIKIVVNGREHEVTKHELSFEEVVALAFPNPSTDDTYTVTYRKADGKKTDGTLSAGGAVHVKDGTIFNVTATHKS
jgi:hypothetical protein